MAGWDDDHWQDGRGTWMLSWKVQEIKIIYECARTKKQDSGTTWVSLFKDLHTTFL